MTMTVQNYIDAAVQRSNLNDPDLIPTAELCFYLSNYEQTAFLTAAKINPDYFGREGTTSTRATSTDSWDLTTAPGNVGTISRIEVSALTGTPTIVSVGDKINVISVRHPEYELAPRVYLRNQTIFEYSSELQDDSSNYASTLKVYYSYVPPRRSSLSIALDLPDEFSDVIIIPLAYLMALRDQRPNDAAALAQEFSMAWSSFLSAVQLYDESITLGQGRRLTPGTPALPAGSGAQGG